MIPPKDDLILITGGNGFIGSYCAARLHREGHRVCIVDITGESKPWTAASPEVVIGNLCDEAVCQQVTKGVHTVLHFAATMGGMGTIHATNDFTIHRENQAMTMNLISACIAARVKQFFFASSACVYPESLQSDGRADVSLRESDVWVNAPPKPQGLYGLEKLETELILEQYRSEIILRIARFHNIYGPGGAWCNGREKAPAALLRKALAIKRAGVFPAQMEVWGSGLQRRSFLWIDDCVDAILLLLGSDYSMPVNIGSDQSISIQGLTEIALRVADVDIEQVQFQYKSDRPVGVASRNANNDLVREKLSWEPKTTLEDGMKRTATWMKEEMVKALQPLNSDRTAALLEQFQKSPVIDLRDEGITFAILLPITSRGSNSPEDCLRNLACCAKSLARTTWQDTRQLGGHRFHVRAYVLVDHDDLFLFDSTSGVDKAKVILHENGIMDVVTLSCNYPPGHVCSLWRRGARVAWSEGVDYILLAGDDVEFQDSGWMQDAHAEFIDIARAEGTPLGFGCVAFTDTTFLGMPTFPIIHRHHLDIFDGEVVPQIFGNQDGDPYLFQLYRRWGCARMFAPRIRNKEGGSGIARYTKQHATDWSFDTLRSSTSTVSSWLVENQYSIKQKLTLDVIIPSYRVQLPYLERILELQPSSSCSVMFIVIVDDPKSRQIGALQAKFGHRVDVRIRVNTQNVGASASRNRGLDEAAADWVHFLDDDVIPDADLLVKAEAAILAHGTAAGFIGTSRFPSADNIFTAAVHLAGVTYFWDIATKHEPEDLPWGVTANLICRRDIHDDVKFDLRFPRTGGGEDIDFCRKKRASSFKAGGEGFRAAADVCVTHPWWNGAGRSYWRFYMWSVGDGGLIKSYPQHVYFDHAPNSAELLLFCITLAATSLVFCKWHLFCFAIRTAVSVVVANVIHDCYRHLSRDVNRTRQISTTVTGVRWVLAVVESSFVRMASEGGRVVGMLQRNELAYLGLRFDWFAGRAGDGPRDEERWNSVQRVAILVALVAWDIYA